jgi:hypothetical protein
MSSLLCSMFQSLIFGAQLEYRRLDGRKDWYAEGQKFPRELHAMPGPPVLLISSAAKLRRPRVSPMIFDFAARFLFAISTILTSFLTTSQSTARWRNQARRENEKAHRMLPWSVSLHAVFLLQVNIV